MNNTGKYIYGVVNTGSHAAGPGLLIFGGVYTIPCMDVSVVVHDSQMIDYTCVKIELSLPQSKGNR